jgi:uncharacterized protein (DUF2141 family)
MVGGDGMFTIPALKDGTYRVLAVKDVGKDGTITPKSDSIAVPCFDAVVRNGRSDTMSFFTGIVYSVADTAKSDTLNEDTQKQSDTITNDTTAADTTLPKPIYQHISGKIENNSECAARYLILLKDGAPSEYQCKVSDDDTYVFPEVLAGEYTVMLFCDVNGNGKYDYGSLIPFEFAEAFAISDQTLKVVERWSVDDYTITFDSALH